MSFLTATALTPLPVIPPPLPLGQTVLVVAVVPGLNASVYGVPYQVGDVRSAAGLFGTSALTAALGELLRQKAAAILAIALQNEGDLGQLLDSYLDLPYDILVPAGLLATTGDTTNASRLAFFGALGYQREMVGRPITTVIGIDPATDGSYLLANPLATAAGLQVVSGGTPVPLGRYMVFPVGALTVNPNLPSHYTTNASASIAGLLSATPPWQSITNQSLTGVTLGANLLSPTAYALEQVGYLVLQQTLRRGITPRAAVTGTFAQPGTPYYAQYFHRLSTLRTCQYVECRIRAATQDLIGEPSSGNVQDTVTTLLQDLQRVGVIQGADLSVTVNALAGTITIQAQILPQYETTMISVVAQINMVAF